MGQIRELAKREAARSIPQFIRNDDGSYAASYRGLRLKSAFQPIFSFAHPQPVGYESLLRAMDSNNTPVSPVQLFYTDAANGDDTQQLERLSQALHIRNFSIHAPDDCWMFLNISPNEVVRHVRRGGDLGRIVHRYGVPAHRIVVEVVESGVGDEMLLQDVIQSLRSFGCLIAIDDFGAGHSNFNRIWALKPDIVKLDRSITAAAARDGLMRRSLPNLSSLIHEAGAMVLLEGVETEMEAIVGMEADVDLYQGYLFGRPSNLCHRTAAGGTTPASMATSTRVRLDDNHKARDDFMRAIRTQFDRSAALLSAGHSIDTAIAELIAQPAVVRCWAVDAAGNQYTPNITTHRAPEQSDPRFRPMTSQQGAAWHLRQYYRRAVAAPGEVQITRPYFSLTGAHIVVTLSIAVARPTGLLVLCCDVVDSQRFPNGRTMN
jgi:EAL domain-containing protein (putative c-di-GMP-specific phosphodiesterase class I)